MVKAAIVNTRTNGNIEFKVLNSIDSDMGLLKWSIIFLFAFILWPLFLKDSGVVAVGVGTGLFVTIGLGLFVFLALRGHSLGKTAVPYSETYKRT